MLLTRFWFLLCLGHGATTLSQVSCFSNSNPSNHWRDSTANEHPEQPFPSKRVDRTIREQPERLRLAQAEPPRDDPLSNQTRYEGEPAWCPSVSSNLELVNITAASRALILNIANVFQLPVKYTAIRLSEYHGREHCSDRLAHDGGIVRVLYEVSLVGIHHHLDAIRTISVKLHSAGHRVLEIGLADVAGDCSADTYKLFGPPHTNNQSQRPVFNLTDAWHDLYQPEISHFLAVSHKMYLYALYQPPSQGSAPNRTMNGTVLFTFARPKQIRNASVCVVQGHPITSTSPIPAFENCHRASGVTLRLNLQTMLRSIFGFKLKVRPISIELTYKHSTCAFPENPVASQMRRLMLATLRSTHSVEAAVERMSAGQLPIFTPHLFRSHFFTRQCCLTIQAFSHNVAVSFYDVLKSRRVRYVFNYSLHGPNCGSPPACLARVRPTPSPAETRHLVPY